MGQEIAVIEQSGNTTETRPVVRERVGGLIRLAAPISDVIAAQEETRGLIEKALKPGRDYGKIPGTDKNSLLKPGGERVLAAYGCYPRLVIVTQEIDHDREVKWEKDKKQWYTDNNGKRRYNMTHESGVSFGLYRFVVRCESVHRETGTVVGMGHGACSTMEPKYIENPRASENTCLKMAEKRAMIDCVLMTFGLSDQFTQDVDEMADDPGPEQQSRPQQQKKTPAAAENGDNQHPASAAQIALIRKLMLSAAFTAEEKLTTENMLGRMPFSLASKTIERCKQRLAEQAAHEKAVAGPSASADRADYDDSDDDIDPFAG